MALAVASLTMATISLLNTQQFIKKSIKNMCMLSWLSPQLGLLLVASLDGRTFYVVLDVVYS